MYSLTFGLCGAISQSQVEIDSNNQTTQHHEGGQTRNDSVANQKHSIYSANSHVISNQISSNSKGHYNSFDQGRCGTICSETIV